MRLVTILLIAASTSCAAEVSGPDQPGGAMGGSGAAGSPRPGGGGGSGAAGAGGTGPSRLALYQSGSRMKLIVGTTPDGAKDFRGWWDSSLKERCSFQAAPDGKVRCLPAMLPATPYFADVGCTKPVVGGNCTPDGYKYARVTVRPTSACAPNQSDNIHALGPPIQASALFQTNPTTKMCEPIQQFGVDVYKQFALFTVGPVVAPSEFQETTESME